MTKDLSPEILSALHKAAFAPNKGSKKGSKKESKNWSADEFTRLLKKPTHFVYGDEHGFILWQEVADEAEILTLAIAPLQQKKGRGYHILTSALRDMQARQIKTLHLEVASDNRAARRLYQKAGFHDNGVRPHYYGDTDAVLMVFHF